MTKFIIEVDSPDNADHLVKLLKSIDYVNNIQTLDVDDELTMEQIAMLDERLEAIDKGEMELIPWEVVKKNLKDKYGI